MRLSSVVLSTSAMSEDVTFAVQDQEPGYRYLIRGMVGIDAEEVVAKFIGFGLVSGKRFYEYTMRPRVIVMHVALNPIFSVNEDVSEIRDKIYRLISANRTGELTLTFKDGSAMVSTITGVIKGVEAGYFERKPSLQITFLCDDPIFRSPAPIGYSIDELPSANPVVLDDDETTAPHGISFKVKFTAITTTFAVQDHPTTPDWKWQVTPATSFQINDELHFSSEFRLKRVFWNKAVGTDVELMDKVVSGSIWPLIYHGRNELYFPQIANIDWLEMKYFSAHWAL